MKVHIPFVLLVTFAGCGASGVTAPSPTQAARPCLAQSSSQVASFASLAAPATTPSPSSAVTTSPAPTAPATFDVAAIDAYITQQMATRGFVGLSVAIVQDGVIVLDKGYGHRQLAPDLPVESDTAFPVASITKQFVASLVLLLAGEKKLSLDDKVAKYFPDLTRARDITLYDLMTHVSGYRDNYPLGFVDEEMKLPITPDETIARFAKRPLDFEPRTRFSYSSTGYKILGRVIEKVTGKPLGVVLEERILRPVGMKHSTYLPSTTSPGLPKGYTSFAFGPPEQAESEGPGWTFGSSGLYAPAGDIARWNIALMSGKVLAHDAYKLFSTPRRLADGRLTTYGCGIQTSTNKSGLEILHHSGQDSGFVGWSYLIPRTRSSVVVLSNRDDVGPWDLVLDIVKLLNKEHLPPPLKVVGPPVIDVAKEMFAAMQSGRVDRTRFGDDFNAFLTDAKIASASTRLRPIGAPTQVDVDVTQDRGGMEQTSVRFLFGTTKLTMLISRSLDGKVQEFSISKP
ncbi:MAG: serine hydrolase domain-containing protein [Polyangiales bacterium]